MQENVCKKIKIFDSYMRIYDKDYDNAQQLDKLSEMLTTYGIDHAFSLPSESDERFDETSVVMYHNDEDDTKLFFIYGLWLINNGTRTDEELEKAIAKHSMRKNNEQD